MEAKEMFVYLGGIHSLGFAVFHLFFWRIFRWKEDLKKNSRTNRAIIQILNIRLIYIFLLVAFLCFFFSKDLLQTALGRVLLIGIGLFWLGRTVEQIIFLRVNALLVHILTLFFILGTLFFIIPILL